MPFTRRSVLLSASMALASKASFPRDLPLPDVYPGRTWASVDEPKAAGFSRAGLEDLRQRIARTPTTGLMVVHGGRVVFEYGDVKNPYLIASMRKSVLSMLFGRHVASGAIRLDATLAELGIDDIGGLSAAEKQATVDRRALVHTS